MPERYAELTLYFGLCKCDVSIGEGKFDLDTEDERQEDINLAAMENVKRYLMPEWEFGLTVVTGYGGYLVRSEPEAKTIIDYAEANIEDSRGIIELVDRMHGDIRFFRKIVFNGMTESRQDELIEQLKKSGYEPKVRRKDELFEGRTTDDLWRRALEFY
jgi:hypothetical protein